MAKAGDTQQAALERIQEQQRGAMERAELNAEIKRITEQRQRDALEAKTRLDDARIKIAQQRADIYQRNIEDLMKYRPDEAAYRWERLQSDINSDQDILDFRRGDLNERMKLAWATLSQRKAEMEALNERTRYIQGQIASRQQAYLAKGYSQASVASNFLKAQQAAATMTRNVDGSEMTELQRAELVNQLFDSFMSGAKPILGTQPGTSSFGHGTLWGQPPQIPKITPGPIVAPPAGRGAPPPAAPAQAAPQPASKIRVRRLSDGVTGTIDAKDFDPTKYVKI